jgi:hypothetical protein
MESRLPEGDAAVFAVDDHAAEQDRIAGTVGVTPMRLIIGSLDVRILHANRGQVSPRHHDDQSGARGGSSHVPSRTTNVGSSLVTPRAGGRDRVRAT